MNRELLAVAQYTGRANLATTQRNTAIREAREAGHSLRAIASAAQMSVEGVRKIIDREVTP